MKIHYGKRVFEFFINPQFAALLLLTTLWWAAHVALIVYVIIKLVRAAQTILGVG